MAATSLARLQDEKWVARRRTQRADNLRPGVVNNPGMGKGSNLPIKKLTPAKMKERLEKGLCIIVKRSIRRATGVKHHACIFLTEH